MVKGNFRTEALYEAWNTPSPDGSNGMQALPRMSNREKWEWEMIVLRFTGLKEFTLELEMVQIK